VHSNVIREEYMGTNKDGRLVACALWSQNSKRAYLFIEVYSFIFFELSALAKLKELEGNNTKVNSKVDKGHKRGGATALHMKASSTAMGIWSLFPEAFFPARTFLNAFTAEINKKRLYALDFSGKASLKKCLLPSHKGMNNGLKRWHCLFLDTCSPSLF